MIGQTPHLQQTSSHTCSRAMQKQDQSSLHTSDVRRRSVAATETAHITDTKGGATSEALDVLNRSMDAANFSWWRKKAVGLEVDAKLAMSDKDPRLVVSEVLNLERDRLLKKGPLGNQKIEFDNKKLEGTNFVQPGLLKTTKDTEVSKEDRAAADVMQRQAAILLDSLQVQREKNSRDRQAVKIQMTPPATVNNPTQQRSSLPRESKPAQQANQKQTTTALENSTKAMQQASANMNGRAILNAINKQTSVMERFLNQDQGRQVASSQQIVPPPRRAPYRSPAEVLSVTSQG